jgi:hypothetical protein
MRTVMVRETLLALLVLALAFLNFGHNTLAFAADGHVVSVSHAYCGDPLAPAGADHTPCHACRIGSAADLPPAPCVIEPVAFVADVVVYFDNVAAPRIAPLAIAGNPRAPPIV